MRICRFIFSLNLIFGLLLCLAPAEDRYVWTASPSQGFPYNAWSNAAHTIQLAVDVAQPGETVWVTNGVYASGSRAAPSAALLNRVVVTNNITIRSVNGPPGTIIEGQGPMGSSAIRCVYMSQGTLIGFSLTNGYTRQGGGESDDYGGGGAFAEGAVLSNCVIHGNAAFRQGGGVAGGTLRYCTVSNNATTVYLSLGGGAYAVHAMDCEFLGNSAASHGGGVATSVLVSCTVSNNSVTETITGKGGGVYKCAVTNSTITHNTSVVDGGGVFGGSLSNCMIIGNISSNYGGGADNSVLVDCDVWSNSSSKGGGTSRSTLSYCLVSNNVAELGGGLYNGTVNDCTITHNSATDNGGGLFAPDTVTNCVISGNAATNDGGGSWNGSLLDCTILGNSARQGGGTYGGTPEQCVIAGNTAQFGGGTHSGTILDCTITNNTAGYGGGANYSFLYDCTIVNNHALVNGGGTLNGNVHVRCTIRDNRANGDGGGLYRALWTDVQNCVISGNTASNYGGGVYGNIRLTRNCTIVSNTAGVGGGVYSNTVVSSIVYYNSATNEQHNYALAIFSNSCTTPLPSAGNLAEPPLFMDQAAGDYHLVYGSPCMDTGWDWSSMYTYDIENTTRPLDGDYDGTNDYDIGAFEYNPATADSDRDGMPDWWEHIYTLNPTNAADATLHADTDKADNLSEYIADTVPTNPLSRLVITAISNLVDVSVYFDSSSNRLYTLDCSDGLTPEAWTNVPGQTDLAGSGGANLLVETNVPPGPRYYRIRVSLP